MSMSARIARPWRSVLDNSCEAQRSDEVPPAYMAGGDAGGRFTPTPIIHF